MTQTGRSVKNGLFSLFERFLSFRLRQRFTSCHFDCFSKKLTVAGDKTNKYKRIGSFKTRIEAEYALQKYSENPFEYNVGEINTFSDLYNAWSKEYFEKLTSDSAIRSVESAYRYCSILYDMPIKNIGPGHIKDVMSNGTWVVPEGKYKGEEETHKGICIYR